MGPEILKKEELKPNGSVGQVGPWLVATWAKRFLAAAKVGQEPNVPTSKSGIRTTEEPGRLKPLAGATRALAVSPCRTEGP